MPERRITEEQLVRTAARLYEAREAMQRLFGPRFQDVMARWQPIVRAAATKHQCSVLVVVPRIVAATRAEGHELDASTVVMLLAACVEESETEGRK